MIWFQVGVFGGLALLSLVGIAIVTVSAVSTPGKSADLASDLPLPAAIMVLSAAWAVRNLLLRVEVHPNGLRIHNHLGNRSVPLSDIASLTTATTWNGAGVWTTVAVRVQGARRGLALDALSSKDRAKVAGYLDTLVSLDPGPHATPLVSDDLQAWNRIVQADAARRTERRSLPRSSRPPIGPEDAVIRNAIRRVTNRLLDLQAGVQMMAPYFPETAAPIEPS